jgi:exopolysaccharide biosynthesis polyprenyl glycosylphosphotransferase
MYKEYHPYKLFLMVADVIVTLAIFSIISQLRPALPGRFIEIGDVLHPPVLYVLLALLWHSVFAMTGVYSLERISGFAKQMSRFSAAFFLLVFVFAGMLFFTFRDVSRMLVIYFSVANFIALAAVRYFLVLYLKRKSSDFEGSTALVVGTSETAVKLADTLMREHASVVNVLGFANGNADMTGLPAPVIGTIDEVPKIVKDLGIKLVFVALPNEESGIIKKLIARVENLPVRVYLVPDTLQLALVHAEVETFGDMVAIGIREPVIVGHRMVVKRLMDLALSIMLLLFLWPALLLIWLAVKLDSPGPALFVPKRVGENGKIFNMYKFRTMVVDAAQKQAEVIQKDEQGRPVYKTKSDPRVTRVGRFLRRTSLDELPQLFNVIKGDMSLVGPRPEQPFITEHYAQLQWRRLSVPPGITGWWQVNGRSDFAMHLNPEYDIYYVRNYSIFLDLFILFKTIGVVIKGRGAY